MCCKSNASTMPTKGRYFMPVIDRYFMRPEAVFHAPKGYFIQNPPQYKFSPFHRKPLRRRNETKRIKSPPSRHLISQLTLTASPRGEAIIRSHCEAMLHQCRPKGGISCRVAVFHAANGRISCRPKVGISLKHHAPKGYFTK